MVLVLLRVLGIPLVLGVAIVRALGISFATDRLAFFGWAWVGGTVATALVEFGWLWFGLPSALALDALLFGLAAALFLFARGVRTGEPEVLEPAPSWERRLFAVVTTLVVLVTAARIVLGSNEAIFRDDEAGFWSFNAKVIFESGGFATRQYAEMARSFLMVHPDYPLLNPLLQVWTFLHFDRITHVANRVPLQLFSLALVLVLAGALRRVARPWIAAAFLVTLIACGYARTWTLRAHSDVLVAFGTVMLLDTYLRWRKDGATRWIGLASLGGTLLLWSKHEGKLFAFALVLAALIAVAPSVRSRAQALDLVRPRREWLALLAPLAILVLSSGFNRAFGYANDVWTGEGQESGRGVVAQLARVGVERVPTVVPHIVESTLLQASHSNYMQLAFLALVILLPGAVWRSALRLPALALLGVMAGIVFVFLGTPRNLDWHLRTASGRVMFQCAPATFLWLAAATRILFAGRGEAARFSGKETLGQVRGHERA